MAKARGFLEKGRVPQERRPIDVRVGDWREVYVPWTADEAQGQASRCMDCGVPFCK